MINKAIILSFDVKKRDLLEASDHVFDPRKKELKALHPMLT
jgi:hypothetical protein